MMEESLGRVLEGRRTQKEWLYPFCYHDPLLSRIDSSSNTGGRLSLCKMNPTFLLPLSPY